MRVHGVAVDIHNRGARRDVRVSTDRDRALSVDSCAIDSAALADFDARPRRVYKQSHRLNACMVAKIAGAQDRVSTHEDLSLENLDVGTSLHAAAFLELHASEGGLSLVDTVRQPKDLCTDTTTQTLAQGSLQTVTSSPFASTGTRITPSSSMDSVRRLQGDFEASQKHEGLREALTAQMPG